MTRSIHRSFRLTWPDYVNGKRVKRRLWWTVAVGHSLAVVLALASFCAMIALVAWLDYKPETSPSLFDIFINSTIMLVPLPVFTCALWTVRYIATRNDWMTDVEWDEFCSSGKRWPESWLEPIDPKWDFQKGKLPKGYSSEQASAAPVEAGVSLVGVALWMHVACIAMTTAGSLAVLREPVLWRWGIFLVSPMATIGIGSLLVCPLFVVYAMMRSDAGFWRRTTTIICETVLWVLHVLVVALYLL